jgi:hypothetical protein
MNDTLYTPSSAYSFFSVLSTDNIGDSLDSLNLNYSLLDNWVTDFQKNYEDNWTSIIQFYTSNLNDMDTVITFAQNYSANIDSFLDTVENNYSKWSAPPITMVYPKILSTKFTNNNIIELSDWINNNFSVQNTQTSATNYFEGQTAIVSCYLYGTTTNNSTDVQIPTTTCSTANAKIYANCSTDWYGRVSCHQGTFNCKYTRNCTTESDLTCSFKDSPYELQDKNGHTGISRIKSTINYQYTDRYEKSEIKTLLFTVLNCKWVFSKMISSTQT